MDFKQRYAFVLGICQARLGFHVSQAVKGRARNRLEEIIRLGMDTGMEWEVLVHFSAIHGPYGPSHLPAFDGLVELFGGRRVLHATSKTRELQRKNSRNLS